MKIERVLNITSDEFYNYLEQQVLIEFNDSNKEDLLAGELKKGLSYTKQLGNTQSIITIDILDYIRNHNYKSRITYDYEVITISYNTEAIGNKLKVIFTQDIKSMNKPSMFKPFRLFSEAIYLGRMSNSLYDIQSEIQKVRSLVKG